MANVDQQEGAPSGNPQGANTSPHAPQSDAQYPAAPKDNTTRNCLLGCVLLLAAGLCLLLCAGVGTYFWLSNKVEQYTSTEPRELPTVIYDDEELAELKNRIETFNEAVEQGETPEQDLELTAEEVNALISQDETLRGKVFVRIQQGEVSGDVSIPADWVPGGKGRYLNGSATFDVSMKNGVLIVKPNAMEINGEPIPQDVVDALAQENWAKDAYKDPETAEVLRKFEEVRIEDDKIILKLDRESNRETETPEETPDETNGNETENVEETPADADADATEA